MESLFVRVLTLSLTGSAVLLPLLLLAPRLRGRYAAGTLSVLWLVLALRMALPVPLSLPGKAVTGGVAAPAASASAGFADVAAGSYCAAAVDWAYEAGITSGASSTGFAPNSALTREQAVTLLCNYAEAQGLDVSAAADLSGYPDASAVSAFAQDAVAWAVDAGLLTGTGAGTLNPQGTATRAELAALLVRAEALFTAE